MNEAPVDSDIFPSGRERRPNIAGRRPGAVSLCAWFGGTQARKAGDVGFYKLDNGGVSPSTYRRADREPDYDRDLPMLEDAIASIADAVAQSNEGRQRPLRKT